MARLLTMGQLRERIGCAYSVAHLRRWAHAGVIPGTVKRPGKHFRFTQCPRLFAWINTTTCRVDSESRRVSKASFGPKPFSINDSLRLAALELEQAATRGFSGLSFGEIPTAVKTLAGIRETVDALQSAIEERTGRQAAQNMVVR
jgi:hypothetical protein